MVRTDRHRAGQDEQEQDYEGMRDGEAPCQRLGIFPSPLVTAHQAHDASAYPRGLDVFKAPWQMLLIVLTGLLAIALASACEPVETQTPSANQPAPTEGVPKGVPTERPSMGHSPTQVPHPTVATNPISIPGVGLGGPTWRGIVVAPEHRCAPYDSDDYRYSQSVEQRIVAGMGGIIYGPYTGTWFASTSETDIEHIVARSEAHDSGLCAADAATRRQFAGDLLNLTLASPAVNRSQKSAKDAAEWLPDRNHCWYAGRVVEVRQRYSLTIDPRERDVLESILAGCASTSMDVYDFRPAPIAPSITVPSGAGNGDALQLYDDNGNGLITCSEARGHGIAPVYVGHPAYVFMDDRDGDGVVCE